MSPFPTSHNLRLSPFTFQQNSFKKAKQKNVAFTCYLQLLSSHSLLNPLQSGFPPTAAPNISVEAVVISMLQKLVVSSLAPFWLIYLQHWVIPYL